jgi:hypothetical protein
LLQIIPQSPPLYESGVPVGLILLKGGVLVGFAQA